MPTNLEAPVQFRKGISVACVRVQTLFVCTQDELIHSGQDFAQRVNDFNVVELERLSWAADVKGRKKVQRGKKKKKK